MKTDILPIGTVVLLEGGTKTLMITGYKMKEKPEDTKVYDYVACAFPEGFMEQVYTLFDNNQIHDVLFVGCMDGVSEYVDSIQSGSVSHSMDAFGMENETGKTTSVRRPKKVEPTNVLSLSEAIAKYTKPKISGGQSKVFDPSSVKESDWRNFIDE